MVPIRNLGDILRLASDPTREAFIDLRTADAPRIWTYEQLQCGCDLVMAELGARGVQRLDRVAIVADNRAGFVLSYLAIMRAGATAVPINHRLARDTLDFVFRDAGVRLAVAEDVRRASCPAWVELLSLDALEEEARATSGPNANSVEPEPGDVAKVLYTSGSTGRPKGVMLTHVGQLRALDVFRRPCWDDAGERSLVVAPAYHKNGLFRTATNLVNGETIISLPRFEARSYLRAIHDWRCTMLTGIPTMFALVARETELLRTLDLTCVRTVGIGSAPLSAPLLERVRAIFPQAEILNGYGTTEAGPAVFGPHPGAVPRPPISLGYPLPGVDWRLVGDAAPREGVLQLRSPAMMAGYLNLPQQTAEKLREGWYDTGDVMRRDENGFFYFVGRADDMFVCGGENVYPGEVEKVLESHPEVMQAVVVAAPDDIKGEIPVAFVVRRRGSALTEAGLREFALRNGPAFSHPRIISFKTEIPVSGVHKVNREALLAEARSLALSHGRATPSGP